MTGSGGFEADVEADSLVLSGRFEAGAVLAFEAAVEQALATRSRLVVDLSGLTAIDAEALGSLSRACDAAGGRRGITLVAPTPACECLLRRGGLGAFIGSTNAQALDRQAIAPFDEPIAASPEAALSNDLDTVWAGLLDMWRRALSSRDEQRLGELVQAANAIARASRTIRGDLSLGAVTGSGRPGPSDGGIPCPLGLTVADASAPDSTGTVHRCPLAGG